MPPRPAGSALAAMWPRGQLVRDSRISLFKQPMSAAIDEVKALGLRTHATYKIPPSTTKQCPRTKIRVHVQQRHRSEQTEVTAMCAYNR